MTKKETIDSRVEAIIAEDWNNIKDFDSVAYYFEDYIENTQDLSTFTDEDACDEVIEAVEDFIFENYNWPLGFVLTLESNEDSYTISSVFDDLAELEARFEYESSIDPRYHSYTVNLWFKGKTLQEIKI